MRMLTKLTLPFLLSLLVVSCSRENPVTPLSSGPSAASGISAEDRAGFDRAMNRATASPVAASAGPNAVVVWSRLTKELGTTSPALPPPALARAYALVQVAVYEAVSAGNDRARGHLPQHALAAGAASKVLAYLFPGRTDRIDEVTAQELALDQGQNGALGAWAVGSLVGRSMVARGRSDGSTAVYTGTPPSGDGVWTGTNPVLPMCGTWKTWVIGNGPEIQPNPPYALGSAADLADVQEVIDVAAGRTPDQIAIVHKWADVSPPAIWNEMLNERIIAQDMDVVASARASAYLNMALADAFIECWACKYKYWTARPFQRIPGLVTVIPTPNFPTYTSGHSTISAAAAAVMGEVFPAERDYFAGQAQEAALSRLLGGIHFRHDNEEGARVGAIIGALVVDRMRGPSS